MKKKTIGLLCLAAGLLVGAAVSAPIAISLASPSQGNAEEASLYNISVDVIDEITVTVPAQAEAGAIVDVAVTAESGISVADVYVSAFKASWVAEGQYRFVMPAHNVDLTVSYDYVDLASPEFDIGHTEAPGLNLINLPSSAEEDSIIDFAITFAPNSGYTFNGYVDVYTLDGENKKDSLDLDYSGGYYSFTMPAENIFVEIGVEKRCYSITKSGDVISVFGDISIVTEDDEGGEALVDLMEEGVNKGYAEFGSRIRVSLKAAGNFLPKGISIDELDEELLLGDEETYIEFDLPAFNVTLEAICDVRYGSTANPTISLGETHPFTYDAAAGTYTSGNKGVSSSTSSMTITCDKEGILEFDYSTEGEGKWDYAIIKHGDNQIFSSMGSGTTSNKQEGHIFLEVDEGDVITISYQKDSSGNVGEDNIVISNLVYYVASDNA